MQVERIRQREEELIARAVGVLSQVKNVSIIGSCDLNIDRIGAISFNIDQLHYNLVVRLLNDRFGIQVRGGWSCASTYCHYLFSMDEEDSSRITGNISNNNMTGKPGWVRLSLHPTMRDDELDYVLESISAIAENGVEWARSYHYEPTNNEYYGNANELNRPVEVSDIFD